MHTGNTYGRTSTHDLHTEVDAGVIPGLRLTGILQLTTSTRRSTDNGRVAPPYRGTSTHDLHTEVDIDGSGFGLVDSYFNSRPPHGGRQATLIEGVTYEYFNSRPPHGGRPASSASLSFRNDTSTHDLHTEVDYRACRL